MSEPTDYAKIYACLHRALRHAESLNTQIRSPFADLSARECIMAHFVLDNVDQLLKAQWEADGSPDLFDEVRRPQ